MRAKSRQEIAVLTHVSISTKPLRMMGIVLNFVDRA